ncbi:membrane protein [Opitutaceae bacterium TAV5]|nr:membrane protein [Opitutaceae bacterium TAV5]
MKTRFASITLRRLQPVLALGWLVVCILTVALLAWLVPRARVDTNILSLLSSAGEDRDAEINEACARRIEQQLLWFVAAPPPAAAGEDSDDAPARWWLGQLAAIPGLQDVAGPVSEDHQEAWGRFLHRYRAQVLDAQSLHRLDQGPDAWASWVLSQVYSPLAGVGSRELAGDPLLLVRSNRMAAVSRASAFRLDRGWLTCDDPDGRSWRMIRASLHGSSFDVKSVHALCDRLALLEQEFLQRWPGAEILRRGAVFYSDYASRQAQGEIALIGGISTLGIIAVSFLLFRSLRPMLLTLLSTGIGLAAGLAGVLLIFGSVHVITLVLATSIIGISEDYAVHYLVERMRHGGEESPLASLRRLLPVLALAVVTSSAAYLVLFVAPFPGFRQLAVCAILGLCCAFATVVCWFPLLSKKIRPHRKNAALHAAIAVWLRLWQTDRRMRVGLPLVLALVALAGLLATRVDDDVARLQGFPPAFRENEKRIAALTGEDADSSWFVVRGRTAEETLRRMEALEPVLRQEQREGRIRGARLLTEQLPSLARQRATREKLAAAAPAILQRLRDAGLEPADMRGDGESPVPPFSPLTPAGWLAGPASDGWSMLWFDFDDGATAALVPVAGAAAGFAPDGIAARFEGVSWHNRRAEVSHVFAVFRSHLGRLLAVAIGVIAVVFVARFGFRQGLRCLVPLTISMGVGLALLALSGHPFNLFCMFALILVVGIGVDCTLFFSNPACIPETAMLSVLMATLTTIIGFGALALSSTPAISTFGLVLAGGIGAAFLLAPLARPATNDASSRTPS